MQLMLLNHSDGQVHSLFHKTESLLQYISGMVLREETCASTPQILLKSKEIQLTNLNNLNQHLSLHLKNHPKKILTSLKKEKVREMMKMLSD